MTEAPIPESLIEAVADAARCAGDTALRYYRARPAVELKADGSPVTIADREAEERVREWIGARFPGDGIVGEELGVTAPEARRRWLIDPIDGTKTFVRGVPLWGSLVAVVEGESVLAGAMYFPALGEIVVAGRGRGAWWNGIACAVSDTADLAAATVVTTDERFRSIPARRAAWERLAAAAALSRSWGDCYGYLLVATGRAELMADGIMSPWDAAALQPIVEEAGGVFTDWSGARTAFGDGAIATNRGVAEAARRALGVDPASPTTAHAPSRRGHA
jgi:histidinol phosphatase-like enzyme (inositol monophosphatase family)